ncbi:hypothetical protein AAZX31_02G286700 [Glycine max]|nr:hypothetical protein GLYMA_02G304850v4 [Glycine max]KAH1062902.1 hypothetical protein GYH30_005710 [Glycine max]
MNKRELVAFVTTLDCCLLLWLDLLYVHGEREKVNCEYRGERRSQKKGPNQRTGTNAVLFSSCCFSI